MIFLRISNLYHAKEYFISKILKISGSYFRTIKLLWYITGSIFYIRTKKQLDLCTNQFSTNFLGTSFNNLNFKKLKIIVEVIFGLLNYY